MPHRSHSPAPTESLHVSIKGGSGPGAAAEFPQSGRASWMYPDGSKYEGEWKDGKRNGEGILRYRSGDTYEGEWRDDMADGCGIFTEANNEMYIGSWMCDKRQGEGIHYRADGSIEYCGNWQEDMYSGRGTLYYTSGDRYSGNWVNDKRHGRGKLYYANGNVYEGTWVDDKAEGKGTLLEATGQMFVGEWRANQRHGQGTYFAEDGSIIYKGRWERDLYHGEGVMQSSSMSYVGSFVAGEREGHGIATYANGNVYDGEWRDGVWNGEGVLTYANGDSYTGGWREGKAHGFGIFVSAATGEVYEGCWKDDMRQGEGKLLTVDGRLLYAGNWYQDSQDASEVDDHVALLSMGEEASLDSTVPSSPASIAADGMLERSPSTMMLTHSGEDLLQQLLVSPSPDTLPVTTQPPDREVATEEDQEKAPQSPDVSPDPNIAEWLCRRGFDELVPVFVENAIDLNVLPDLNDEDLRAHLGIRALGVRKRLLRCITDWKGSTARECVICMDQPQGVAVDPCGHISMCGTCARRVDACPMCRGPIRKTLAVFHA